MVDEATGRLQWVYAQLAAGWRVEGPVIERAVYRGQHERASVFEFVLRHERGCQAMAVNDCPEVRSFIRERQLASIAL
ncbi:hypothetical protein SE17_16550 [Kouleothrix aurantiaca]|jgi:hypothetical protein|uniref:Uncharacterized protein n=1 Tax=Kouleothrix aurantiaca TaxID=186479 RepID=A0A0P9FGL3_9CHLR|nr:hypothetical protein SE17_16550 [Kouleothrix aurantiaca]